MFDVGKIREEFPILGSRVYGRPLVYLDSGATAQKPLQVIEAVDRFHREQNANIHRGVHLLSEEATEAYEAARTRIAAWIGAAEREEVVFTAGATASLNTVAYAWGEKNVGRGSCWPSVRVPKSASCLSTTTDGCVPNCSESSSTNVRVSWPLRRPPIPSARGPICDLLSRRLTLWGLSSWSTGARVRCMGVSTFAHWTAIFMLFRAINFMDLQV